MVELLPSPSTSSLPDHLRAPTLYAGFWRRFAACLIDGLVLVPALAILEWIWIVPTATTLVHVRGVWFYFALVVVCGVLAALAVWLYFALCEASRWQATVGKFALALRVSDECGHRVGFGRASARCFGKVVSAAMFGCGFLLAGWSPRKQALHDVLSGCCVVRRVAMVALEHGELPLASSPPVLGAPGWAVALIVVAAGIFVGIPALAVLAIVGVPVYQTYAIRAEVAQGIALSRGAREAVTQYIARYGALPDGNAATGLASADSIHARYVASVAVRRGQVVVTFGNQANFAIRGDHLVLVPQGSLAAMHWQCRSPDLDARFIPSQCRE